MKLLKNLGFQDEVSFSNKALSNLDIEEIMSKERSMKGDGTISDMTEELFKRQRSDDGTPSPYISDSNEIEQAISTNSIESQGRYSDVSFYVIKYISECQKIR